jgi:hypothetical protein
MSLRFHTIKKAFLIPLGLDAFLLFCLLLMSLFMKGDLMERLIFTFFFLAVLFLFLKSFLRRIAVAEGGLVIRKLWHDQTFSWEDLTHVGCLTLHRRVYLLLTTVKGFFIVSDAFERFSKLVADLVAHVEPGRVEEDVCLQAGRSRTGIANVVMAWVAAAIMIGIIVMKLFPFTV